MPAGASGRRGRRATTATGPGVAAAAAAEPERQDAASPQWNLHTANARSTPSSAPRSSSPPAWCWSSRQRRKARDCCDTASRISRELVRRLRVRRRSLDGGAQRRAGAPAHVDAEPRKSIRGSRQTDRGSRSPPPSRAIPTSTSCSTTGGRPDAPYVPSEPGCGTRLESLTATVSLFASTPRNVIVPGLPSIFRLWSVPSPRPARSPRCPKCYRCRGRSPAAFSPDGRRIAYEDIGLGFAADWAQNQSSLWRNNRGGRTRPIRLITLADNTVEKLPWTNSNDSAPMWVGDTVYFLSDRNGTTNLFSYRPGAKEVTALTRHDTFDVMNASATSDAIVYEQGGDLVPVRDRVEAGEEAGD